MPEPPKVVRSLEQIQDRYTVFEPNQVLSEGHLNQLASYLVDQDRITRIELCGVGIAGGLRVAIVAGNVRVRRGVGVTTDGDLLVLAADTVFDRFRPYGEAAPRYAPFFGAGGAMVAAVELVAQGVDDAAAQPLAALNAPLDGMVVVMLMESYLKDTDLCSGTDCDNAGLDAVNTPRMLLVPAAQAGNLDVKLATDRAASSALPVLAAGRPQLAGAIANAAAIATPFRDACTATDAAIVAALPQLAARLPEFTTDLFGADPAAAWIATLRNHRTTFAAQDAGIQYYYGFLKDVVEAWNALRDALGECDGVLCPDMAAFPKHLLLGNLANPRELRTAFYPAPFASRDPDAYERARFAATRLHVLINTFAPPVDNVVTITPSRPESAPLEERAIPYYYAFDARLPIHWAWSYRLTARGDERRNFGYRAAAYGGDAVALRPLEFQVGACDFFRIEGHQGQQAQPVEQQLKAEIARRNLPIVVRSVLAGNDRARVVIKPPIRYTDLHRFHKVLRTNIETQLDEAAAFSTVLKEKIDTEAAGASLVPRQIAEMATPEYTRTKQQAVVQQLAAAKAPLQAPGYSAYRQVLKTMPAQSHGAYQATVGAVGDFKAGIGDLARADVPTPFDTLIASPHRAWVDWLDLIIDARDQHEDGKLLMTRFLADHPGIDYQGGVRAGGTFVLVYDAQGRIVADFALPYAAPEAAEEEPPEPALPPPVKPPIERGGVRIIPRLPDLFDDFKKKLKPEWEKDIAVQKGYLDLFTDIVNPKPGPVTSTPFEPRVADRMLGFYATDVNEKTARVERLRDLLADPALDPAARTKATKLLQEAEGELGKSISTATEHIVKTKADVAPTADGGRVMGLITRGIGNVTGGDARANLGRDLVALRPGQVDNPQGFATVGNLLNIGGFGR